MKSDSFLSNFTNMTKPAVSVVRSSLIPNTMRSEKEKV